LILASGVDWIENEELKDLMLNLEALYILQKIIETSLANPLQLS